METQMMKIVKWLKRQLDKWPTSPGLIQPGNWYVIYDDGKKSQNMTYDVCRDYAKIFGGKVHHLAT